MSVSERVRRVVEPVVADAGLELFDLEQAGPVLRVTVDQPGGLDMSVITSLTRALSQALDESDPIADRYTLEVSSPGLERPLRTPVHWAWAVGRQVAVKAVPGYEAGRRFTGTVATADTTGVTLALDEPVGEQVRLAYSDIEKARTVFVWGGAPKPGTGSKPGTTRSPKSKGPKKPAAAPGSKKSPEPPSGTEVQAS
jgi:ribosome maturation factor RimP